MGCIIGDQDKCLFDIVAQEVNKLAGVRAIIYQLDEERSEVHPLYGEPKIKEWIKKADGTIGYDVYVFFNYPDRSPMAGEEGFRTDKTSIVFLADKERVEKKMREPRIGDIVKVWNMYWDVVKVNKEGIPSDNDTTSLWSMEVARRTKAPPESLEM